VAHRIAEPTFKVICNPSVAGHKLAVLYTWRKLTRWRQHGSVLYLVEVTAHRRAGFGPIPDPRCRDRIVLIAYAYVCAGVASTRLCISFDMSIWISRQYCGTPSTIFEQNFTILTREHGAIIWCRTRSAVHLSPLKPNCSSLGTRAFLGILESVYTRH
jgi:hypothetical protein